MSFSNQKLRGQSFKHQDLSYADFSGADVHGADFSNALLFRADLSRIKTGLNSNWALYSRMSLFVLTALANFVAAYASTYFGALLPVVDSQAGRVFAGTFAFISFVIFILLTVRQGLGIALAGFAIIEVIVLTILAALPGSDITRIIIFVFAIAIAIATAGIVAGSIAVAIARILSEQWIRAIATLAVFAAILVGLKSGTESLTETWQFIAVSTGAVPILFVSIGLSLYIGTQAIAGNPKYALICRIAVAACNYGGTSFRGADLTDADLTGANLKHADFRDATLTRTCWSQAKHLAQARTDNTYLEKPQIRQLVVSLNGQDQNFDHLDLRGLNLQGANLADASLIGAKLSEATLQDANLARAKLVQTQLYAANLTGACLTGAVIQDWSISTDTNFAAVKCDYVYMQLPTKTDPDPCRKPDNRNEAFQAGDFADFIAPIIKTLSLYQTQHIDLRLVAQQFKTLDLFHHEGIDPTAAAIALKQLAQHYPEAELEVVALEGRGEDKVRVQAKVTGRVDRSALSAEYFATYEEISALPYADLQSLLAGIAEKDERIRSLENMVMTAIESNKFYVETYYNMGDTVSEKSAINISSGGGNVSGIVGGDIKDVSGVVNLGTISGDVANEIRQLPDASSPDEASLKELLIQLKTAIETEPALPPEDKAEALAQVKTLAQSGQAPEDNALKKAAKTSIKVLKGTVAGLPDVTKIVQECNKLLPAIATLLTLF
jgi:uncharacterized protein YjbI with pentapeptide repeats